MRRTFGFVAFAALAAVAVAQTSAPSLLSDFGKALKDANTLQSTYTIQLVGGTSDEYSVALKKPNQARFESPQQLIVADGKEVTTYQKSDNTYYVRPQTEKDVQGVLASEEANLFSGFFNADAYQGQRSRLAGKRSINGTPLNVVETTSNHRVDTYFIADDKVARKRQTDFSGPTGTTTNILNTKSLILNADLPASTFTFTPPANARQLSEEEMNSAKWYTNLEEAEKIARATHKKVFIDFMATWCGPCKQLEKTCFYTPEFKALGKSYVFCRIDCDEQPSLAQRYGATSIPLQVIVTPDGAVVESLTGWGGAERFFSFMNRNK